MMLSLILMPPILGSLPPMECLLLSILQTKGIGVTSSFLEPAMNQRGITHRGEDKNSTRLFRWLLSAIALALTGTCLLLSLRKISHARSNNRFERSRGASSLSQGVGR